MFCRATTGFSQLRRRACFSLALAATLNMSPLMSPRIYAETLDAAAAPQLKALTPKLDTSLLSTPKAPGDQATDATTAPTGSQSATSSDIASTAGGNGAATTNDTTSRNTTTPTTIASLMQQGVELTNKHEWTRAADIFKQVLGRDPNNVNAYYNLGAIAETTGDLQQALNFYKGAQSLSPQDAQIGEAVASVQKELGVTTNLASQGPTTAGTTASYPYSGGGSYGASSPYSGAGAGSYGSNPYSSNPYSSSSYGSGSYGSNPYSSNPYSSAYGSTTPYTSQIPGTPAGYSPSPSYYGTSTPNAVSASDPNFVAWQKEMKKEHRHEVEAKVAKAAMVVGFVGLMIGLAFV